MKAGPLGLTRPPARWVPDAQPPLARKVYNTVTSTFSRLLQEIQSTLPRRIEEADREKRMKERQAAKLLRKLQLAELRAKAGSRATGEERRKVRLCSAGHGRHESTFVLFTFDF